MNPEKQIYLLESECGRIKLGSSSFPRDRMLVFSNLAPRPVRLIAVWPGTQSDELQLHKRFVAYRTHNEWFRLDGEFAAFVESKRGVGVSEIPTWQSLTWTEVRARSNARKSASSKATRSDPKWKAEQAANRAWRKLVEAHEAQIGRVLTFDERSDFYDLHHPAPIAKPQPEKAVA